MNKTKLDYYFYDGGGLKAVTLDGDEGWVIHNSPASTTLETYVNRLGWLRRCVSLIADTAKSVPFVITKNGKDFDSAADWQNKLGVTTNPRRVIEQLARALVVYGNAYLHPAVNPAGYVKNLEYWIPSSLEVMRDTETNRVTKFRRAFVEYPREDVLTFWPASEQVEDGPAPSSAAISAMFAAGALYNMGEFVARYFENGAVRVTLLAVKTTDRAEAQRIGDWWRKFVTGKNNAYQNRVINADAVEPRVIGDGLKDLENNALETGSVQAIAAALGVPQSMLLANAANYATARVDQYNLYNTTVIPLCDRIADALNEQLFTKKYKLDGYKAEFRAESLDAFHEDELTRAGAYAQYIGAGIKPSIAAQICGIELPGEMDYAELDAQPEPAPAPEPQENEADEEMRKWQRKALNAIERGKSANVAFVTDVIPDAERERIAALLQAAKTAEDVKAAFLPEADALAKELKRANDLLEAVNGND